MSGNSALNPVTCSHHLPALRLTTKKAGKNQGRVFYKCAQAAGCGTFIWEDELPGHSSAAAPEGPVTPSSSQRTLSSQHMNQSPSVSQGFSTPGRKRAGPQEDNDDIQSPFDTSSQGPFTPNKRVKFEGSSSSLGQAWAPPSPATQPSGSQNTVASTSGDGDESLEEIISRLDELPAYIKKLQRKKIAAEKSSEVKNRKIAELQKQVERLKAREQELEEALAG